MEMALMEVEQLNCLLLVEAKATDFVEVLAIERLARLKLGRKIEEIMLKL